MFLISGISPKNVLVDVKPQLCPVCGLARAHYKRIDHYFSFFFIPLFRVRKGEAFLICDKCEKEVKEFGYGRESYPGDKDAVCRSCGKNFKEEFKYCPYCGKSK